MIGVSASKGGSMIAQWQPGQPLLIDLLNRLDKAKSWLMENNIRVGHIYLLWLQGESDGDFKTPPEKYASMIRITFDEIKKHGVEHIFLLQIGHHRDDQALYLPIQEAQTNMDSDFGDMTLVSTCLKTMAERGLMKDPFHYHQAAYNECGEEAAQNTVDYLKKQSIL
ncbi:sialate O-acetylesterase [Neobacillus dielmonensis]|uniref:sialate O-acetylesterase n=1 Tax=Neobacillus dielmonensis TaxID=1347369 RepID=UPI0029E81E9E|nr:sialate O-acetylesterase [Neobacillus dielmonensis]